MKPIVGKRYRVRFDDCCAKVSFDATVSSFALLDEHNEEPDNPTYPNDVENVESITFDNGVTIYDICRGLTMEAL